MRHRSETKRPLAGRVPEGDLAEVLHVPLVERHPYAAHELSASQLGSVPGGKELFDSQPAGTGDAAQLQLRFDDAESRTDIAPYARGAQISSQSDEIADAGSPDPGQGLEQHGGQHIPADAQNPGHGQAGADVQKALSAGDPRQLGDAPQVDHLVGESQHPSRPPAALQHDFRSSGVQHRVGVTGVEAQQPSQALRAQDPGLTCGHTFVSGTGDEGLPPARRRSLRSCTVPLRGHRGFPVRPLRDC